MTAHSVINVDLCGLKSTPASPVNVSGVSWAARGRWVRGAPQTSGKAGTSHCVENPFTQQGAVILSEFFHVLVVLPNYYQFGQQCNKVVTKFSFIATERDMHLRFTHLPF